MEPPWLAAARPGEGTDGEEALPLFERAFELEPSWHTLAPRLPGAGLLPDDPDLIERITSR